MRLTFSIGILVFALLAQLSLAQIPQTMSYQGVLTDASSIVVPDGTYSLVFGIYDVEAGSAELWSETHASVAVVNGIFNVILGSVDPLNLPFDQQYWLEVEVNGAALSPRVQLTSAAYSLNAQSVADGAVTESKIAFNAVTTSKIHDNAVTGSKIPNGQVVRSINGKTDDVTLVEGANVTITPSGSALTISSTDTTGNDWSLTGNAGTNPLTNFLGTTDNQPLELRVNDLRILRLESSTTSPNIIAGHKDNSLLPGVYGATIGGGGSTGSPNKINSNFSTIGGGASNTTNGSYDTVGGGQGNVTSMSGSTVAGGTHCAAISTNAFVGGGAYNMVSARYGTIGGGGPATGETAGNSVLDDYGTVGGGQHNQAGSLAGTSEDAANSTVGGGKENTASGYSSTIAGGEYNDATGDVAIVAGGSYNVAAGTCSAIMGGFANYATGHYSTLMGGMDNEAQGRSSSIGGGKYNVAKGEYSTIGGGGGVTSSVGNQVTDNSGTVGGGADNQAGNGDTSTADAPYATVGGGTTNTASGEASTIGGGSTNTANSKGTTIGGGWNNAAMANFATVAGGGSDTTGKGNRATQAHSTVSGGFNNVASGEFATVSGGGNNTAGGYSATVAGGVWNEANGQFSFAAGRQAKSSHDGCFVWGDNNAGNVESSNVNQFIVRSTGGVYFYTSSDFSTWIKVTGGGNAWSYSSDRGTKENFVPVDGQYILKKLAEFPIQEYNLRNQEASIRHIGPMAQDFYAAFGMGEDERHISTADADGVALAAIQGLYELVKEKDAQIAEQQDQIAKLVERLAALEASISTRDKEE